MTHFHPAPHPARAAHVVCIVSQNWKYKFDDWGGRWIYVISGGAGCKMMEGFIGETHSSSTVLAAHIRSSKHANLGDENNAMGQMMEMIRY